MNIIHRTDKSFFTLFGEGTSNEIQIEYIPGFEESEYFHKVYEPQKVFHMMGAKKQYWGVKENRVCRFCKRDSSTTTFRMLAHIVPEFMSNKVLVSNFECDQCNSLFSEFETSFCNYMGIFQTLSLVKGKNGVPKYVSNDKKVSILSKEGDQINIKIRAENESSSEKKNFDQVFREQEHIKVDLESKKMTFNTVKRPYTPIKVLKTLVKIGFCFLDESDLKNYERARLWLLDMENPIGKHPFFYLYKGISNRNMQRPLVILYRKRNHLASAPIPEHSLLVFYGIFRFQLFMPLNMNDEWLFSGKRIHLPLVEQVVKIVKKAENQITCDIEYYDLSSILEISKEQENFSIPFIGRKINPPQ